MPIICPTITAETAEEYKHQVEKVAGFAHRIQIDLTDGQFAPRQTVPPAEAWWPVGMLADIHLMFKQPEAAVNKLLAHKPNLIIIHAEAEGDFEKLARQCHDHHVKVGVALLPDTQPGKIASALGHIDHVMIFSGNLGYQGGSQADLSLLDKAGHLKTAKPDLEIGWDGGVNYQNIAQIVFGGVDVINVGGFIQHADDAEHAYRNLARIADETGTT